MIADESADWQAIGLQRGRVADLADREAGRFARRTPRSAQLLGAARERMPRGVPMGWMADFYPEPPIFAARGEGATFWDADDNAYLDFSLCDLSTAVGFAPPALVAAIGEQARLGVQFLLPTEDATAVAAELARRFGPAFWQFTLSASQANSEALRLARLATGRDRVLLFGGRYHGHLHETLHAREGEADEHEVLGLPQSSGADTSVVEFNDLEAARRELARGDVAAVLLEPVLTNCTVVLPDEGFHSGLREICDQAGTLLIIDETHTQFAVWGGATGRFGLGPDIVTGGKGIAGGIPIGVYGMGPELAALMERHPASDFVDAPGLATGGTLFANALSLAAARTTLTDLLTEDAYAEIERLGARLAAGIDAVIDAHRLPWSAHRFGGRSGLCLRPELPRTAAEAELSMVPILAVAKRSFFANRGVWDAIATAGPSVSTAHQAADIDAYLEVLDSFLAELAG